MKTPLHLDLLKEEERFSSRPIRLRVILPLFASFLALCLLVWYALLWTRAHSQVKLENELKLAIESLTPVHASVLETRAREQECRAIANQLSLYTNSLIRFGKTLSLLASHVPANIQLTELRIFPPSPADPVHSSAAPTNVIEQVFLRISGRTGGEHPSEEVNKLLAELRTPVFTNLFHSAAIPKGAFRQDGNRETLLFEITCECQPRRFQ